jgi:hypothetical protein
MQPLQSNAFVNKQVNMTKESSATIEKLLEAVLSMWTMPKCDKENWRESCKECCKL